MSGSRLKPGTFKRVSPAFMRDRELKLAGHRVGNYLYDHADNDTHQCCPSIQRMADELGVSRSAVIEGLAQNLRRGHVTREKRSAPGRGQTSSVYTVIYRAPEAGELPQPEGVAKSDDPNTSQVENVPSEPRIASASPDLLGRSPGAGDHSNGSPASDPVTDFSRAGDLFSGGPVTCPAGHLLLESLTRKLELEEDEERRAPAREASAARELTIVSDGQKVLDAFNEAARRHGWPCVQDFHPTRQRLLDERIRDCNGIDGPLSAIEKVETAEGCAFLREAKWFNFDWLFKRENFAKIMEGNYNDPKPHKIGAGTRLHLMAEMARRAAAAGTDEPAEPAAPAYQPPPPKPPRDRLADELRVIVEVTKLTPEVVETKRDEMLGMLKASGFDADTARAKLTEVASRVPKTSFAIIAMQERVDALVLAKEKAA